MERITLRIRSNRPGSLKRSTSIQRATTSCALILLCFLLTYCAEPEPKPVIPVGQVITDTITSEALKDNKLGDPHIRNMTIYLPPSYNHSDKMYPVIYLLHGYGGDERSAVEEVGETVAALIVDGLIKTGLFKEIIIVMPSGANKYGGSYFLNSELIGNYEDYIAEELVNFIDNEYRTIRDRDGRAIAGASMGGYGSITLGMKHPETYCAVASLNAPLWFDPISEAIVPEILKENPDGMDGPIPDPERQYTSYIYALSAALSPNLDNPPYYVDLPFEYPSGKIIESVRQRWMKGDPFSMLSDYGSSLKEMKGVYIDIGDEDLPGFPEAADAFHQELLNMGIKHKYIVYHGGHSYQLVARSINALRFISDLLPDPKNP